ncbi:MAG: hypothetical protein ACNYZG_02745, partial [Gammaproteobacteria bacterium]
MSSMQNSNIVKDHKTLNCFNSFLLLFLANTMVVAHADNMANGVAGLPESYRTPLSESLYKDKQWRVKPEDVNP